MKSKRITVFCGAGSAIEIGGQTTDEITEKVKEIEFDGLEDFQKHFIKEVAHKLETFYKGEKVNFEEIFNALERLNSYMYAWRQGGMYAVEDPVSPGKLYRPPLGAFLEPTAKMRKFFKNDWIGIVISEIIRKITDLISEYDKNFKVSKDKNEWYSKFWRDLDDGVFLDISTLNYDTCIEGIIECDDGFEENGKFNPLLLEDMTRNKILHLHGCINYAYPIYTQEYQYYELIKCVDSRTALLYNSRNLRNHLVTQGNEFVVTGPLITGLSKTEKIQTTPYVFYNAEFTKSIIRNDALLIIGYSVGDYYLNEILDNFIRIHRKKKLILISKLSVEALNNPLAHKDGIHGNLIQFINKEVLGNNGMSLGTKFLPVMKSNDGLSLAFMNGFHDAVTYHSQEIIDFLKLD